MKSPKIGLRATVVVAGVAALVGLVQAQDSRESGLQITPDELRTLISKDVGTERWAITRNADDNSVTGNVFFPSGGDPLFVFCEQTGTSGADLLLDCFGADPCGGTPCGGAQWTPLAEVTLPESFFLPTSAEDALLVDALASAAAALESGTQLTRESGLQVTPDDKRTILSKDVGSERWAITRNLSDGSVTGNVFFPEGGDPLFVFCEQTGTSGDDLNFDCFGSDVCEVAPCPGDLWSSLASVTLAESFFLPDSDVPGPTPAPTPAPTIGTGPTATPSLGQTPTPGGEEFCGNGVVEGEEECDGADLDDEDCFGYGGGLDECTGALACASDCTFDASSCSCPCEEDLDCDFPIDCEPIVEGCDTIEACDGSTCITTRMGTSEVCNGLDPFEEDPEFTRCAF